MICNVQLDEDDQDVYDEVTDQEYKALVGLRRAEADFVEQDGSWSLPLPLAGPFLMCCCIALRCVAQASVDTTTMEKRCSIMMTIFERSRRLLPVRTSHPILCCSLLYCICPLTIDCFVYSQSRTIVQKEEQFSEQKE